MQNNWFFKASSYREILDKKLKLEGKIRGYRTLMAKAAGCQQAYLSQVLAGNVQLTPEHASGLCNFWGLDELESDYFLTLVELGRSGQQHLNQRLLRRLENIKIEHEKQKPTHLKIEGQGYQREKALFYYLDWVPSAVHMLLAVPGYDRPSAIAKHLRIPETVVVNALNVLNELGMADRDNLSWKSKASGLHAADESLFAPHHHRNWREKAIEYFRHGKIGSNLHYTSVYSLDQETFTEIRNILLKAIEASKRAVVPATEKAIACINVDWFEI